MPGAIFLAVVAAAMIGEAVLSARHERVLRAAGAVEPPGDVYRWMQATYPAAFVLVAGEGWARGMTFDDVAALGLAVFVGAKALKYWAMATLGPRWSFRVLVPPRSIRTARGPYRWLRHPNYIGVAGELIGAALFNHAWVAGPLAVVWFCGLMWRRVQIEEGALAAGR